MGCGIAGRMNGGGDRGLGDDDVLLRDDEVTDSSARYPAMLQAKVVVWGRWGLRLAGDGRGWLGSCGAGDWARGRMVLESAPRCQVGSLETEGEMRLIPSPSAASARGTMPEHEKACALTVRYIYFHGVASQRPRDEDAAAFLNHSSSRRRSRRARRTRRRALASVQGGRRTAAGSGAVSLRAATAILPVVLERRRSSDPAAARDPIVHGRACTVVRAARGECA
jgi:hypothetical protein